MQMLLELCAALLITHPAGVETSSTANEFVPPKLTHAPEAEYPEEALKAGVEGAVHLKISIDPRGHVRQVEVLEGPGYGLEQAALIAVSRFRFEPARIGQTPVPANIRFHYKFELPTDILSATSTKGAAKKDKPLTAPPPEPQKPEPAAAAAPPPEPVPPPPDDAPSLEVMVRAERPPRSSSDFVIDLGLKTMAPTAGASGADLLKKAPGVYISQHSGQGKGHQIFIRGFDAVHGQDVEVHAGGIPVNEASNIHAQGYVDLHFLIPEVVQRMRVLEGPFDPRQGDFAVAGSIEFGLGLPHRGVIARATGGRFNLRRAMVAWGPKGQPEETFVAAEIAQASGFGPSRAWRRASGIGQALVPLSDNLELRLLASSYTGRFDSAGVVRLDDYEAGRIDFFDANDRNQGGASERHQALVELTHRRGKTEAMTRFWVLSRDFTLRQNFTGFIVDTERGDLLQQINRDGAFGGRGHYRTELIDNRLDFELGVNVRHDSIEQTQERLRSPDAFSFRTEADNNLGITNLGVWGDLDLKISKAFAVRGGLRIESISFRINERLAREGIGWAREAFGFHAAPKLTLDLRATSDLRLFASYGNGFRSPTAVSLGQGESSPLTVVHAGELGARYELGQSFEATLAGFATYVEEDLIFDHSTGRNIFTGPTLRTGGVLVVKATPAEYLELTGALTLTRAVKPEEEGSPQVPFVPAVVGQLDADFRYPLGEVLGEELAFTMELEATALSPRPLPFSEEGQAVFVLEGGLGLDHKPFSLSVEAFNLTDARWRDSEFVYRSTFVQGRETLVPARHFTAGRPLTVQATLTARM